MSAAISPAKSAAPPRRPLLIDFVISLVPWVIYMAATLVWTWSSGFTLGLVVAALIVVWRVRRNDSRLMDLATVAYCAVMTAVALLDPRAAIRPYNLALSLAVIGVIAMLTVAAGSPATLRMAEARRPEALSPDARRAIDAPHRWGTLAWSGVQYVAALAAAGLVVAGAGDAGVIPEAIATLLAAFIVVWSTEAAERRLGALSRDAALRG